MGPNPNDFTFPLGQKVHRTGKVTSGSTSPSGMKSPNDPRGHRDIILSTSDFRKSVVGASDNRQADTNGAVRSHKGNRKESSPMHSYSIMIGAAAGLADLAYQLIPFRLGLAVQELFQCVIFQSHVLRFLSADQKDLGHPRDHLDCPLVALLGRETMRPPCVDDFVNVSPQIHADFNWPFSIVDHYNKISSSSGRRLFLEKKLLALEVDVTLSVVVPVAAFFLWVFKHQQQLGSGYLSNASNGTLVVNVSAAVINNVLPMDNGVGLFPMVETQLTHHTRSSI